MKLILKVLAFFIPALVALFYFLGRDNNTTSQPNAAANAPAGGIMQLAKLPSVVSESSGVEYWPERNGYLTHNDAGNKPHLYLVNEKGQLIETIKLKLPNVDWEDLARDDKGNVYIADTGNNNNKRRELAIYKLQPDKPDQIEAIRYTYEDQKDFPPAKKDMNFDVEAIFWHSGKLYLVSKDRGQKETAKVYELPDKAGTYKAKLVGQHKLGVAVTGAASSPSGKIVALVSNGGLHIFNNVRQPASYFEGDYQKVNIKQTGQTEAVAFENENTLVITSEDGGLYRYSLN